jgi:nucleotide-binding universal stress UspA family protein
MQRTDPRRVRLADPGASPGTCGPDHECRRRYREDVLAQFEARARDAGVGFSGHHIHSAGIARAISRAAEEHGCDMIVMATHGRGALGELVFGSHTKDVMARSKLPLLVLQ